MRSAVETDPLDMADNGLMQILAHVIAEMKGSVNKDIKGFELLQGLLNAPWLQSLLKVYECLQQHLKHSSRPYLSYSSGLSLQILSDLLAIQNPSNEARELHELLSKPHLQALLSAHDTVSLRDYDPELPPLPKDLPEDEEAMRIICLVKNNQPLIRAGREFHSHWDTLRRATRCGFFSAGERMNDGLDAMFEDAHGCMSADNPPRCPNSQCNASWDQMLSCSSNPCVCSSVVIDDFIEDVDSGEESDVSRTFPRLSPWSSSTSHCYHASHEPPRKPAHARTAPPSSTRCHGEQRVGDLRSMLHQAFVCAEHNSENIQLLGERMLAATDRMSESMQENSHAVMMLTHVLEKLQEVVARNNTTSAIPKRKTVVINANAVGNRSLSVPVSLALASGSSSSSSSSVITLLEQSMLSKRSLNPSSNVTSVKGVKTNPSSSLSHWMKKGSLMSSPNQKHKEIRDQLDVSLATRRRNKNKATSTFLSSFSCLRHEGATIRRDDVTGEIYIARVIHGGLAERSGLLHAGDRLVEVNGHPVFGLEPEQIIQILAHSQGTIMFKVVPITDRPVNNQTMLYVRAMVDYNPHVDPSIPCADAGMAFRKGDILEIVDQTDALWWQAIKLPRVSSCAGLIPSTSLLKRKQKELWWSQPYQPHSCISTLSTVDEEEDMIAIDDKCVEADEEAFESEELKEEESDFSTSIQGIYLTGFRRSLRLCRRRRGQAFSSSLRCPTSCYSSLSKPYEEVVRYQHHPDHTHRLIVLMGPSGVGVNELRRRLIEINPKVYQGAVPHTTRPPKCHEESGREYHFISKEQFDIMVCNHRFIEFGEFNGHLYGTSVDAVKDVLASEKICVIDIEPYALESVRTPELRAYVIYIKPPSTEQMKHTRMNSHIITNYYISRPFKDEDFQEIEDAGHRMEQQYRQFFDHVIVNDGLQAACVQLLTAVRRAQDEPQWVPAAWIRPTEQS